MSLDGLGEIFFTSRSIRPGHWAEKRAAGPVYGENAVIGCFERSYGPQPSTRGPPKAWPGTRHAFSSHVTRSSEQRHGGFP